MKKITILILLSLAVSAFAFPTANAATFKSGENLVVTEPLPEDSYIFGGNVTMEENVTGDLYIAGGTININGNVANDLVVAGGNVNIFGNIGDDLRVAGGMVMLFGNVGHDVLAGAGQLEINKKAVINGDLYMGSGYMNLAGEVKGGVQGGGGVLIISGKVAKDVIVTVEDSLKIADTARIGGNLQYTSVLKTTPPPGTVAGTVTYNELKKPANVDLKSVTYLFITYRIVSFLSALLFVLLFVILLPKGLVRSSGETKRTIFKTFGMGAATFIAMIIASIALMITVVGIPLGVILMVGFFVMIYLAKIFAAMFIAGLFVDYEKIKKHLRLKLFFGMALGLLIYYLLELIPILGWLAIIFLFFTGIGMMFEMKKDIWLFLREKRRV